MFPLACEFLEALEAIAVESDINLTTYLLTGFL